MSAFSSLISRPVLLYLKSAAKLQVAKNKPRIIGITGSAGKTSTRNAVAAVLQDTHALKVSYKANSESGIPLNVLDLAPTDYSKRDWFKLLLKIPLQLARVWPTYDTYVVEMGIDAPTAPKNMGYLLSIIQPQVGIFLNVGVVHAQAFDALVSGKDVPDKEAAIKQAIAQEKGRLITSLPPTGLAILNADDPLVLACRHRTRATVATFGRDSGNTVWFDGITQTLDGTSIRFHAQNQESATLHLKSYLLPDHFASSFAAALCVALRDEQTIVQGVEKLRKNFNLPPGRSSLIPGIKGSLIIDSSYNASTLPTIEALSLMHTLKPQRALAILGDMREIGSLSEAEHIKVAEHCLQTTQAVYLVGPQMKAYALPFLREHNHPVSWYPSAFEAAQAVEQSLHLGDVVLIKGSQNTIFLETAVKHLMRQKNKAQTLLCRQSSFWEKQRAQNLSGAETTAQASCILPKNTQTS